MVIKLLSLLLVLGVSPLSAADQVRLAVASNFLAPIHDIARAFEAESGHRVLVSGGSTGKLYAQIVNGAPYDVFLAANSREPQRLEDEARILAGSRYTYARGALALWVPGATERASVDARSAFRAAGRQRVAIANPRTAPYGAAAAAVLEAWGQTGALQGRLVRGENISQAYQFVASGNAGVGFVALSQLLDPARPPAGRFWRIDAALYAPIRQQVVLLKRAAGNPAAQAFWRYLRSAGAGARIKAFGYELE